MKLPEILLYVKTIQHQYALNYPYPQNVSLEWAIKIYRLTM